MQTDKNKDKIQDIALMKTLGHTRCGLGVSMGVGKTRIGIHHIIKNYDPFGRYLVVVPKNTVIESWKNEIDIMDIEVDLLSQMNFVNYRSIHKLNPNDYDIVYLDECHNLLFSHEQFLGNYNGKILKNFSAEEMAEAIIDYQKNLDLYPRYLNQGLWH